MREKMNHLFCNYCGTIIRSGFSHRCDPNDQDPNDKGQHEPGAKLDQGKNRPSLILSAMPRAIAAVVEIGEYGARKYTPRGWLEVPDGVQRYTDAMYRHQLQGEIESTDSESGLLHAAHAAWNSLARLELLLRAKETGK